MILKQSEVCNTADLSRQLQLCCEYWISVLCVHYCHKMVGFINYYTIEFLPAYQLVVGFLESLSLSYRISCLLSPRNVLYGLWCNIMGIQTNQIKITIHIDNMTMVKWWMQLHINTGLDGQILYNGTHGLTL